MHFYQFREILVKNSALDSFFLASPFEAFFDLRSFSKAGSEEGLSHSHLLLAYQKLTDPEDESYRYCDRKTCHFSITPRNLLLAMIVFVQFLFELNHLCYLLFRIMHNIF
jgi:hypothetical protein